MNNSTIVAAAIASLLITVSANAQAPVHPSAPPLPTVTQAPATPTIDFTRKLIGINGIPLWIGGPDCSDKAGLVPGKTCAKQELTLSDVAVGALYAQLPEDQKDPPQKKLERDDLARKIYNKKAVVLSSEEISALKQRIGEAYNANIVGPAWRLLDPSVK